MRLLGARWLTTVHPGMKNVARSLSRSSRRRMRSTPTRAPNRRSSRSARLRRAASGARGAGGGGGAARAAGAEPGPPEVGEAAPGLLGLAEDEPGLGVEVERQHRG